MAASPSIYERLGIPTCICAYACAATMGRYTLPEPVVEAMVQASRHCVSLEQQHGQVGARRAELTGAEAAAVSTGAAGGLLPARAARLTGTDGNLI
jgi:D-glucosaminate-6-phosphate ammonia-lyase